jgi:hypothetical protein
MNTPTPSFPVELQKERLRVLSNSKDAKAHVKDLTRGIFPEETLSEGITPPLDGDFFLWRPNNYRLKIPILEGVGGSLEMKVLPPSFLVENVSSGVTTLKIAENIIFQVGKKSVMLIYSLKLGKKKVWCKVPKGVFDDWVSNKVREIEAMLLGEVKKLELPLNYEKLIWIKHEDGLKGEEFLDEFVAQGHFIDDTYFKQVYVGKEANIEFKSPSFMKTYIANRSLEKLSPEIVKELQEIKLMLEGSSTIIQPKTVYPSLLSSKPSRHTLKLLCLDCGKIDYLCHCLISSGWRTQEESFKRLGLKL